ncbi:MAG: hypothetical protein IJC98_04675 [Clostridia bacterium]|nr:hypothetical protein [Clostridia bacterium]
MSKNGGGAVVDTDLFGGIAAGGGGHLTVTGGAVGICVLRGGVVRKPFLDSLSAADGA